MVVAVRAARNSDTRCLCAQVMKLQEHQDVGIVLWQPAHIGSCLFGFSNRLSVRMPWKKNIRESLLLAGICVYGGRGWAGQLEGPV